MVGRRCRRELQQLGRDRLWVLSQSWRAALCRRYRVSDGGQRHGGPRTLDLGHDARRFRWALPLKLECVARDALRISGRKELPSVPGASQR
jgi:hypothetical protein